MKKDSFKGILEKNKKITILALNWRDPKNPKAGGAEVHAHEMFHRNIDKFQIIHLSPMFIGGTQEDVIDGVRYIRKGNVITVILYAMLYYIKNRKVIDVVIDQCNTHRFFTSLYVPHKKRVFYIHQLCRELWYVMLKKPISSIGYFMETPMLWLNRKDNTITVSNSTKQGLLEVGFNEDNITIVPNGISFYPPQFNENEEKYKTYTFIYAGRYSNSKGINHAVEAIGKLKENGIKARLLLIGRPNQEYIESVLKSICEHYHMTIGKDTENDIVVCGFVSEEEKRDLLRKSHALVLPSIREGWGIVIIEAAMEGTPSIVYNSPGCIDAIDYGNAGYLCKSNCVEDLYKNMQLVIEDKTLYKEKRRKAYNFSKQFNWEDSAEIFRKKIISIVEKQ